MMKNKELYKQAFRALHAPDTISLKEVNRVKKAHLRPTRRMILVCACVILTLGLAVTAYAYADQTRKQILGWMRNMELITGVDENGAAFSEVVVHTEDMAEPVLLRDSKLVFIVNGEQLDITNQVSQIKSFRYEYLDEEGNTHLWLVGLNSDVLSDYGYAEYIKDTNGLWAVGYSARVNIEPDGHTSAQWLETAKNDLNVPW